MSINNNNNNKKLSVKHNDEVMDAFNLFDKDHDKRINSEEILSLIAALGGDTECQHVQDLVLACELNHGSLGEYSTVQWCSLLVKVRSSPLKYLPTSRKFKCRLFKGRLFIR